jgi:hypothetical protein
LKEVRYRVVARAWGLPRPSRPPDSDAADDPAVVQNQDLEHQPETHVSNKGVKVPPPTVDSECRSEAENS